MSAQVLQVFGGHSVPQPVMSQMPMDLAMRLCLSQSPPLCQFLGVSSLKPLRPCIQLQSPKSQTQPSYPTPSTSEWAFSQSGISGDGTSTKKKRVVFADSKGLSLTAVRLFSVREEIPPPTPSMKLRLLRTPATERKAKLKPWKLGFQQPLANIQAFRTRLQENLVQLESCSVTERALSGTVQVKNVSFEKAVKVRITFDSWRSWRDVPCTFLRQCYGGSDTDIFVFDIPLPKDLNPLERVQFCVSYLPRNRNTTLWDNNKGQNYSIICSESVAPSSCHTATSVPNLVIPLANQSKSKPRALNDAVHLASPHSCKFSADSSWVSLHNLAPFW